MKAASEIVMLPEYEALYEQNPDDTVIDYPVMQTMEDEAYYLAYDFNKEENITLSVSTAYMRSVIDLKNQHPAESGKWDQKCPFSI